MSSYAQYLLCYDGSTIEANFFFNMKKIYCVCYSFLNNFSIFKNLIALTYRVLNASKCAAFSTQRSHKNKFVLVISEGTVL